MRLERSGEKLKSSELNKDEIRTIRREIEAKIEQNKDEIRTIRREI